MGLLSALVVATAVALWLTSPSSQRLAAVSGLSAPVLKSRRCGTGRSRRARSDDTTGSVLAQAPIIADLLATAIAAGATVSEAICVIARVVDEPIRSRLQAVMTAINMGADPHAAWSSWLDDPALSPIAQAIIRSQHSGSPLSTVLDSAAADMRQAHRADVEARARAAGVRAVAPLALCYLPAYLLVGVVPVVAGFASTLFA